MPTFGVTRSTSPRSDPHRRNSSTASIPSTSEETLPQNQRAQFELVVDRVNDSLDDLIRALDRMPVPETAPRNDVWTARATHDTLRGLSGRLALLLWFWHLGDPQQDQV